VEHAGEEAVVHKLPKECATVGTSGYGFGFCPVGRGSPERDTVAVRLGGAAHRQAAEIQA
jgi:hypothetical protein